MNLVKKAQQKVGEGLGAYAKTEESEEFKQQEKYFLANSNATDRLVKELTPDSAGNGLTSTFRRDSLQKTQETKRGEAFISLGTEMKAASYDSVYAEAIINLGESLRLIGDVHQTHDAVIIDSAVGPMRLFNDNVLKDIHRLEKNYKDKRLEYDSALRTHRSKSDSKTQGALDTKTRLYEDARQQYLEKIAVLPVEENAQVGYLAAYCQAQSEYYKSIASMYSEAGGKLETIKNSAPAFSVTKSTTTVTRSAPAVPQSTVLSPPPPPPSVARVDRCRGLYDFDAGNGGELSFRKGDVMVIRKRVNEDWFEADLNGLVGLVPVNYVEIVQ